MTILFKAGFGWERTSLKESRCWTLVELRQAAAAIQVHGIGQESIASIVSRIF